MWVTRVLADDDMRASIRAVASGAVWGELQALSTHMMEPTPKERPSLKQALQRAKGEYAKQVLACH